MSIISFDQAEETARDRLGTVLFTVTVLTPDCSEVARVHSSHPDVYAVGGRKRTDPSQTSPLWFTRVLTEQKPFLGLDKAALREFFFDWQTIENLGCGAIINTPVVRNGETIGSINFLGPEGSLDESSAEIALGITHDVAETVEIARLAAFPEELS